MMKSQLTIDLQGDLGGELVAFRRMLGLKKEGRLSDDWDQGFGWRLLRAGDQGGGRADLHLYRETDDSWSLTVNHLGDPLPADQLERIRHEILASAVAVGMTVTAQVPPQPADPERSRDAEADGLGVPASRLAAARELLAAWQTEQPSLRPRTITPADLATHTVRVHDEWLVLSPPGRANSTYLVSDVTVYSYAPSQETLETALHEARGRLIAKM